MHRNNHLYSTFFAQYETLFRYCKPSFINPGLLDDLNIPLEKVLEDEAAGMAFPLDAKYFDDFQTSTWTCTLTLQVVSILGLI